MKSRLGWWSKDFQKSTSKSFYNKENVIHEIVCTIAAGFIIFIESNYNYIADRNAKSLHVKIENPENILITPRLTFYPNRTSKHLKGMTGVELFTLSSRDLEHYCGVEWKKLNEELTRSRIASSVRTWY